MKKITVAESVPLPKLFYTSLAIGILIVSFTFIFEKKLPPEVPLFYGLPEGGEQLSQAKGLSIPGLVALFVTITNFFFSRFSQSEFIKKSLIAAGFCVSILALITTVQ